MFLIVTSQFICTGGRTLALIIEIKLVQYIYWLGIAKKKKRNKEKKKKERKSNKRIEKRKKLKIKRNLHIDSCIQLSLSIFRSQLRS